MGLLQVPATVQRTNITTYGQRVVQGILQTMQEKAKSYMSQVDQEHVRAEQAREEEKNQHRAE